MSGLATKHRQERNARSAGTLFRGVCRAEKFTDITVRPSGFAIDSLFDVRTMNGLSDKPPTPTILKSPNSWNVQGTSDSCANADENRWLVTELMADLAENADHQEAKGSKTFE